MSLDNCTKCFDLVDTDTDGDAYLIGDKCLCWSCREASWPEMGEWMVGERKSPPALEPKSEEG